MGRRCNQCSYKDYIIGISTRINAEAFQNIWRGDGERFKRCIAGPLLRLVDCCSNERLRWYTRKIHHVWIYLINSNERFRSLLEQGRFQFPNARSINIYIWMLHERHLARLLTPKVVALRLFSPFGPAILDEIKVTFRANERVLFVGC